ncbi:MAG: hypothetical protein ACOH2H_21345 [Cypionkella sp.]
MTEESGFTGCQGWLSNFCGQAGASDAAVVVTSVTEHGLDHRLVLVQGRWRAAFEGCAARSAMERLNPIAVHVWLPLSYAPNVSAIG